MMKRKMAEQKMSDEDKARCEKRIGACSLEIGKACADSFCAIGFLSPEYFSDGIVGVFGIVASGLGIAQAINI